MCRLAALESRMAAIKEYREVLAEKQRRYEAYLTKEILEEAKKGSLNSSPYIPTHSVKATLIGAFQNAKCSITVNLFYGHNRAAALRSKSLQFVFESIDYLHIFLNVVFEGGEKVGMN